MSKNLHDGEIVILSPKSGQFKPKLESLGVRILVDNDLNSAISKLDNKISCCICNTIMSCHHVLEMINRQIPVLWILHEWWDDEMIEENFRMRNIKHINLETVKTALTRASRTIFVCEAQRNLYKTNLGAGESSVIFVGVADPFNTSTVDVHAPLVEKRFVSSSLFL